MTKIIGIDPGYDRCGVAVVGGTRQKPEIFFSCCIQTSAKKPYTERLLFIFNALNQIIKEQQPEHMAVEDIFFTTNQKTAIKVSQARGGILLAGSLNNLKIKEYTPLQIKTYLTGYGKADKKQIFFMIEKLLKLTKEDIKEWKKKEDDEVDAIAIALTHLLFVK